MLCVDGDAGDARTMDASIATCRVGFARDRRVERVSSTNKQPTIIIGRDVARFGTLI